MIQKLAAATILAIAVGVIHPAQANDEEDRKKAAAVIGAIIGAVVAAKVADDNNDDARRHPYRHRNYNRVFSNRTGPWHPAKNITCYPNLHACYKTGHGYNANWTRREFH